VRKKLPSFREGGGKGRDFGLLRHITREERMRKKATKFFMFMGLAVGVVAIGMLIFSPAPVTAKHQYTGTLYVAGMGGHFAVVDVGIDPSAAKPIQITSIDKIDIGESSTHPTHDARIDTKDRNTMYWSTYKKDKSANNQLHVGKSDLKTGKVLIDKTLALPEESKWAGANYCGSGQSEKYFLPVSMASSPTGSTPPTARPTMWSSTYRRPKVPPRTAGALPAIWPSTCLIWRPSRRARPRS
jgi:hypothetical protein